jgi:hypothetical protein
MLFLRLEGATRRRPVSRVMAVQYPVIITVVQRAYLEPALKVNVKQKSRRI